MMNPCRSPFSYFLRQQKQPRQSHERWMPRNQNESFSPRRFGLTRKTIPEKKKKMGNVISLSVLLDRGMFLPGVVSVDSITP